VSRVNRVGASGLAILSVAVLAACTGPTRVATLNNATRISGTRVQSALQQELARQGHPNAMVTCARSIVVNVGPAVSCTVTGAGANQTVHFTFKTLDGVISVSSVKAS
jgi:hypothetical protein